jgi:hypothetical protein
MATCPNKNTKEWKETMLLSQNNEKLAMEVWVKKGYADIVSLNKEDTKGLSQKEINNLEKDQEKKESDFQKTDLQILSERTKIHLRRRVEALGKVKIKDATVRKSKLQKLLKNMEALDEIQSINEFIGEQYKVTESLMINMEQIVDDAKSNPMDGSLVERLVEINNAVNGSEDVLKDIANNKDIVDFFNTQSEERKDDSIEDVDELSIQDMLYKTLANRVNLKRRVNTEAMPLIADWLMSSRSSYANNLDSNYKRILEDIEKQKKNFEEGKISAFRYKKIKNKQDSDLNKAKNIVVDKDDLINTLREASREDGVLDFMIGPAITSPDAVVALTAKVLKDQLEKARLKDITIKENIANFFIEYNKSNSSLQDNPKKFNEGLYEIIEERTGQKDDEGNDIYKEELHFVSKYDMKQYKNVIREWYKKDPEPLSKRKKDKPLTDSEARDYAAWMVRKNNFYKTITKLKSDKDVEALDEKMLRQVNSGIITQEEFDEWVKSKDRQNQLSEPIDKFLSDKWKAMYDQNDQPINIRGKYHKELTAVYYASQDSIPESQRPGTRAPSVPKRDLERLIDKGVINLAKVNIKEAVKIQSYDTEFGELGLNDEGAKFLPVFYTRPIDISDQSFDLASTVLLFSQMANKYEALNEVNGEISLLKSLVKDRKVPEFNQSGERRIDAFANKFGLTEYLKQHGDSYSKRHLDAFIDMIVYGEMNKATAIGNISANKVVGTVIGISALTSIAADLLKGVANNLQGNIQLVIEAKGAEFFNAKNLRKGKSEYAKALPAMLKDFGKPTPTSLMGRLAELYDPLQGNFQDKYGNMVTASIANKLFRTDTLFFNQYFGEHELQLSTMIALMDATMVRDKESEKEITLFQAHQKYGMQETFDKIEFIEEDSDGNKNYRNFTEKDRRSFQDRLHALNKKMHGVYNNFDKGTLQRYWYGKLALMYRKHMYPGYMRRFQSTRFDEELGSMTEGFYGTFWRTFMRDLITYKKNIGTQWSTYTPHQKANIRKTLTEYTMILSIYALIQILTTMAENDEDLKENYAFNFLLYQAVRMRSETSQYTSLSDAWRTVKSPTAALTAITRITKFAVQILPWNITEEYKRDQGIWEKGDNKAWAYFIKMIGLPGYNIKPQEAVKVYESLTAI